MPTFTSQRPAGIAESFASLMQGNKGLSQTDILNAEKTISGIEHSRASAQNQTALAEKVRLELEQMRNAENMRKDPAMAAEFGARSAGINLADAGRIDQNFRGESLPPTTPMDDEGNAMPAAPIQVPSNVNPQQLGLYNAARAGLMANNLATGKTNGEQLTKSVGDGQQNSIVGAVQTAIANKDMQGASAMSQGAKPGQAIKLYDNVTGTGASINNATGKIAADPNANPLIAATLAEIGSKTGAHKASAANSYASAAQHGARTAAIRGGAGEDGENAAAAFLRVNGAKLSSLSKPQALAWMKNHADGMDPADNLASLGLGSGAPLKESAVKSLAAAGDSVEGSERLSGTFKPQYGGKTILGDLSNTYKRIAGDETGQAQWWQDMDTLQNQTRHALFGSALTATELAAWNKTSVTPRMAPTEIVKNLERRKEIEARAASKLGRSYAVAGYNEGQIQELLGVGAKYLEKEAPPVGPGSASKNDRRSAPRDNKTRMVDF